MPFGMPYIPSFGDQVDAFANNHMGQQVGNGECYALADEALRGAGARSAPDFGKITGNADYKWGQEVDWRSAQSGDILQFRNHKIEIRTDTKTVERFPDGRSQTSSQWKTVSHVRGHHTAIVSSNNGGGVFTVYEQHVKPPGGTQVLRQVQENQIQVVGSKTTTKNTSMKVVPGAGTVTVEEETTVTVKVTGKVWVYRPQPKP